MAIRMGTNNQLECEFCGKQFPNLGVAMECAVNCPVGCGCKTTSLSLATTITPEGDELTIEKSCDRCGSGEGRMLIGPDVNQTGKLSQATLQAIWDDMNRNDQN